MIHNIIIRGQKDDGKTTTCVAIYKELIKDAQSSKLFTMYWNPIKEIQYSPKGEPSDFIAIIVIEGIVIIIISAGDYPQELIDLLNNIDDQRFLQNAANINHNINFIICCAKSRNVDGSTIRKLYEKITNEEDRKEFWVPEKSLKLEQAESSKIKIVNEIIEYIKNFKSKSK